MKTKDRVFRLFDGFYCFVAGRTFGPWPMAQYAKAGLRVEQRRAARRKAAAR